MTDDTFTPAQSVGMRAALEEIQKIGGPMVARIARDALASQPSRAATVGMDWKLSDDAKQQIDEINRNIHEAPSNLVRLSAGALDYLDTLSGARKEAMESHASMLPQCSADTEDELGLYDLGESFLAEYERATKDGYLKNFVCAESPVEVLWHLINEVDELRLEIDQLRQAAREPDRDAVAAIVLKAMHAKVDPDTYGASYAIEINADRAIIAADAILSLHRPELNETNIT